MSPVPFRSSMAERISLSTVWADESVARSESAVGVCSLRSTDVGDVGNHFSGNPAAADEMVSSDLVGDEPEERGQCAGIAARAGFGQL